MLDCTAGSDSERRCLSFIEVLSELLRNNKWRKETHSASLLEIAKGKLLQFANSEFVTGCKDNMVQCSRLGNFS